MGAAERLDELFDQDTAPWSPQVGPQLNALSATWISEMLYGGAAYGGKTEMLLNDYVQDVPTYGAAWRGILFRKTMGELDDIIQRSRELYPRTGGFYNESKAIWRWPNGAYLRLRYLEQEKHKYRYQGQAFSWIGFDELTHWHNDSAYRYLRGRLRSAMQEIPTKRMRSTANPGGVGHGWVKAKFISPAPGGNLCFRDPETGEWVIFIPARITDNRIGLRNDPQYINRLRGLGSAALVKALLEGDWNVIEGAYFDCWSTKQHVIRPFKVPVNWTRFRSGDWGSASPFSFGWWAVVQDNTRLQSGVLLPRGAIVRYREWYGTRHPELPNQKGLKLSAGKVGEGIAKLEELDPRIFSGVLDPSTFKADGGPPIAEMMNAELIKKQFVPFGPADNTRVNTRDSKDKRGPMSGWDQVRGRLVGTADIDESGIVDWSTGRPMMYFFNTCIASIRTIPELQHDPQKPEDLDTKSEDHCFSAGTLVETDAGRVPIEALPESGLVMSSSANFEAYRSARLVKRNAPVVRIKFDNGVDIKCTPDHRFLVDFDEWSYASDLTGKTVLCSPLSSVERSRSSTASDIICVADTFRGRVGGFISKCGSIITAPSRLVATSTTPRPEATTVSMILSVSHAKSTSEEDTAKKAASGPEDIYQPQGWLLLRGMDRQRASSGTPSTSKKTSDRRWRNVLLQYVSIAVKIIWSPQQGCLKESFAETTVRRVRCVSVDPLNESADVYCMTVPSTGCFAIEGGILVSNCADDVRYACSSRPFLRGEVEKEEPKDAYAGPAEEQEAAGQTSFMTI